MIAGVPDYKTLLSVYMDHTSVVNTLWGIFHVVSLALLGFVYREQPLRQNWLALLFFSVAFLVFTYSNQRAMARSQQVLVAVVEQMGNEQMLEAVPEESGMRSVLRAHKARCKDQMKRDHSALSIGVALIVWVPLVSERLRNLRSKEQR